MKEEIPFPPLPPPSKAEYDFIPGNFDYIEDSLSRAILENGYKAISVLELWDYMKKHTDSYMMSTDKEITLISDKMVELGYDAHSGFSFAWTMRQLQTIAICGEQYYKLKFMYDQNKK